MQLMTTFFVFSQSPGDLVITEIMFNPKAVRDTNGEYFEVYNTTDEAIEINNWTLTDDGSDAHDIQSEKPIIVPAQSYFLFARKADKNVNGGFTPDYIYTSFTLANTEDEVILRDTTGQIIDKVAYNSTDYPNKAGKSISSTSISASDNDNAENWKFPESTYGEGADYGTPGVANFEPSLSVAVNVNSEKKFKLYPNPTIAKTESVSVDLPENTTVQIFTTEGKYIASKVVTRNSLEVKFLPSGVYVLAFFRNSQKYVTKLVVQ